MILFRHQLVEIEYDKPHKLLQVRWTDPLPAEEYQRALQKIAEIISAYQVKSLLLETYNSAGNDSKNELWTSSVFLNRYRETGLHKIARVCLDNTSDDLPINRSLHQEQSHNIEFRQFKYQFEAYDWLWEKDEQYLRYGT